MVFKFSGSDGDKIQLKFRDAPLAIRPYLCATSKNPNWTLDDLQSTQVRINGQSDTWCLTGSKGGKSKQTSTVKLSGSSGKSTGNILYSV